MTDTLTYPFLESFYDHAQKLLQPGTLEWVRAKCRGQAGGKSYPANQPLSDTDEVTEGIADVELYKRVYNAVVPWAGKDLAERVAKEAMPPKVAERDAQAVPYREKPVVESSTYTEEDMEGLDDDIGALFVWTLMHPRLIEVYGADGKQPPDYVPEGKRSAWIALWNAVYRKYKDEGKAFAIANGKFAEKG